MHRSHRGKGARQKKRPLAEPLWIGSERKALRSLNVRCLQALVTLHDLKLNPLTLGQRLVAVHRDRGKVNEHVVPTLTLDEPEALLVRKPLDGSLCQLRTPCWMTTQPPSTDGARKKIPPCNACENTRLAVRRARAANGVLEQA